jgi:uncharacterized protein (TIGR03086 family)
MPTISAGIVALDAQAVRVSVALVAHASTTDMARPTPCADWTLHGLISHMAAQHYGFAAASAGDGDLARWRPRRLGGDPVADYRAAAETVLAAFSAPGVLDREFPLPEFPGAPVFPARQAVSFHFVDYVVHSWDVAKSLGLEVTFAPELLDAALRVAQAVPGGESRRAPGAAFAPAVAWPAGRPDGSPLDQIVAILGRSPDWKRPQLPVLPRVAVSRAGRWRRGNPLGVTADHARMRRDPPLQLRHARAPARTAAAPGRWSPATGSWCRGACPAPAGSAPR